MERLVRVTVEADLPAVLALDAVALDGNPVRRDMLRRHVTTSRASVVEVDGEPCGFAVYDRSFFEHGFVQLLRVHPEHRRAGLGSLLLTDAAKRCETAKVFTSTSLSNALMLALLAHLDWSPSGMLHGLDRGDPEVFYFTSRPITL